MKAAVYSGSRNLYPDFIPAAKSMIANSSVDKIYFLIEDDKFPYELPPIIECINISGQTWFPADGPNMKSCYTYMALCRSCYDKLFPDLDRILSLDIDTIVIDNIDELWDLDMTRKWLAACEEKFTFHHPYGIQYFNIGVTMFNLDEIRKDGASDRLIELLNKEKLPWVEQDGWNKLGYPRKILELPTCYNENFMCGFTEEPKIVHYCGRLDWQTSKQMARKEYLKKYREMTWEEAFACRSKTEDPDQASKKTRARKTKASAS